MTPDAIFSFTGPLALLGWAALAACPLARRPLMIAGGFVIPVALSVCYLVLILSFWTSAEGGFDSLPSVMRLFDTPGTALAGWVHFLAFDLFVGGWIVRDAERRDLNHLLTLPSLGLTFLFGPIGLLLYLTLATLLGLRAAPQT